MEIYKAAGEDQTLKNWFIRFENDSFIIARPIDSVFYDVFSYESLDHVARRNSIFITKQRGGIRRFASLDAACNAIRQIGQARFEVQL